MGGVRIISTKSVNVIYFRVIPAITGSGKISYLAKMIVPPIGGKKNEFKANLPDRAVGLFHVHDRCFGTG